MACYYRCYRKATFVQQEMSRGGGGVGVGFNEWLRLSATCENVIGREKVSALGDTAAQGKLAPLEDSDNIA
jgi:hypothetical protein